MRLATVGQSKNIDRLAQANYGLTSEVLMESAGAAVAEEIHAQFKNKKIRIIILIGPGNNGADGMVTARLLKRKGFGNLACAIVREKPMPAKIWSFQHEKAANSGVDFLRLSADRLKMEIANSEVIVEAIFGTGATSILDEEITELVRFINSKNKYVVTVDGPLGLDFDTGLERPVALRSQMCVTFGLAKPGFFISRGPRCIGKLKIHSIGFPLPLLKAEANSHFAWGEQASHAAILPRDELSNKSNFGEVHVIAGSREYPGAGLLAANAAGRCGAGYTIFHGDTDVYKYVQMIPEVILREQKLLDLRKIKKESVILIGPGLGVNENCESLIRDLIKRKFERVILDADAISVVAQKKMWPLPNSWVVTPHTGELSRVLGRSANSLNSDRWSSAAEAAKLLGCIVLFKGFRTIISSADLNLVVIAGNSGLAKAGSGDVLSGFIGALMAQGLSSLHAAALGAYLHGRLSREWTNAGKDISSLLPSDLTAAVPELINKIRIL